MKLISVVLALLLVSLLAGCGVVRESKTISTASLPALNQLAVKVDAAEHITVVNEEMDTTATSAVFFGIAGALATVAYDNVMDGQEGSALQAAMGDLNAKQLFSQQLGQTLQQNQIQVTQSISAGVPALSVVLEQWGVRRNNRDSQLLVPFVIMAVEMEDANGKAIWKKHDVQVGQTAQTLAYYQQKPNYLRQNLVSTLRQSAEYIANQLIYR